jgi:hypothetical protein
VLVFIELEAQLSHCFVCRSNDVSNLTFMLNALLSHIRSLPPFTTNSHSFTIHLCVVAPIIAIATTRLCGFIYVASVIIAIATTRLCGFIYVDSVIIAIATTRLCGYIYVIST